ncbi:uncharacterized protein LOC109852172 isoform X2 [Pseudomyrmex gracilis]|uniref:uncharacterized protein LOC109852172 isoform X2 n=1 Tax=Pseudomyrmex gracilis TaxID=219809 RepID=UPI000994A5A4|nr:uncharacterized protein LOC109852172 isoform X2 [Pseudomyrmex gracilis]
MMVRSCCICKSEHGVQSDVSFHRVPQKDELREKWISVIGHQVTKNSSVCSNHFTDTDFRYKVIKNVPKRYLMPDAVPSVLHPVQQTMTFTISESLDEENTEQEVDNGDTSDKHPKSEVNSKQSASPAALIDEDSPINEDYLPLERKNEKKSANPIAKRFCHPRFIGDLCREDFTSRESWEMFEKFRRLNKIKLKTLNQKVTRLNNKLECMRNLLRYLGKKKILSKEEAVNSSEESM